MNSMVDRKIIPTKITIRTLSLEYGASYSTSCSTTSITLQIWIFEYNHIQKKTTDWSFYD